MKDVIYERSRTITQFRHAFACRAVITAKHPASTLEAMSDDAYTAVFAGGRKGMDRAFEAIKGKSPALGYDLKRFVVLITASITFDH